MPDSHLDTCAVAAATRCPASNGRHRWSGWPGAWCLDCGALDVDELCIGRVCECPCHDQFWAEYQGVRVRRTDTYAN